MLHHHFNSALGVQALSAAGDARRAASEMNVNEFHHKEVGWRRSGENPPLICSPPPGLVFLSAMERACSLFLFTGFVAL